MQKIMIGLLATLVAPFLVMAADKDPSAPAANAMEKFQQVMSKQSLTAKVVMTMTGSARASKTGPMEFQMAISKGKARMDMDIGKMASASGAPAGAMPPGLDKMVMITRPDKKVVYHVMPGLKAYAQIAIPDAKASGTEAPKIDRKVLGTEKVDKYNCEKVLNIATAKDGTKTEVTTWEAKELKGMPVKVVTTTGEGTATMLFRDINTATPADSLFEPPAGATKYGSMQEMMMSGMMKMMQGMGN